MKGEQMFVRNLARLLLGLTFFAAVATSALAAPVTFRFLFTDGTARATGTITLESTLVNPGAGFYALPNPAVLGLQVTVTGATAGNGTFGIGSFTGVIFDTAGSTLDFSRELVGQTAGAGLWGTTGGDFNLFGTAAPAPLGVFPYALGANFGGANTMLLTSMSPANEIPTLGEWGMIMLSLLLGLGAWIALRRRSDMTAT